MVHDLIIIGAGPAGYHAALRAGKAGLSVLLVEKKSIGGVCLNEGCIPTKTILHSAKIYDAAKNGEKYGVLSPGISIDHRKILIRKNKVVKTLIAGVVSGLKKHNVTLVEDNARLLGKSGTEFTVRAGETEYRGNNVLVASGALPVIPRIPGLDEAVKSGVAGTSAAALGWPDPPAGLVVIGAGVIGLELASYWNSLGSRVTLLDVLPQIGGALDPKIAALLEKNYRNRGVSFRLSVRVTKITNQDVSFSAGTEEETLAADRILIAAGRRPSTDGLGLEETGVLIENGRIKTDEKCRTSVPGIFAAGDVNGISMLAHTAYREAEVCVNTILGRPDRVNYETIPSVIYTNPEVAGVGETEESARVKGIVFDVAEVSMRYSGRYLAENEGGDGICRILAERSSGKLLGVHLIANAASELIYGASLMIEKGLTVSEIRDTVFPHPTVGEIIKEAASQL